MLQCRIFSFERGETRVRTWTRGATLVTEIAPLENNRFCHLARPITFYRTRDICIEPSWGKKHVGFRQRTTHGRR